MPFKKGAIPKGAKPFNLHPENINKEARPRKLPEIDKLLADVLGKEKDGLTAAEIILAALNEKAAKGDVRAAEVLLDRAYGKATERIEHNFPKGIQLEFTDDDTDQAAD
jgi:hypothetical protein